MGCHNLFVNSGTDRKGPIENFIPISSDDTGEDETQFTSDFRPTRWDERRIRKGLVVSVMHE